MTKSPKNNLIIPTIFLEDRELYLSFIRGVFDTDFGLKLRKNYPSIVGSSKCRPFMEQIGQILEQEGFRILKYFDYKIKDSRLKKGYNIINRIEINGHKQLEKWIELIGTNQPKNLRKIELWKNKSSGGRI